MCALFSLVLLCPSHYMIFLLLLEIFLLQIVLFFPDILPNCKYGKGVIPLLFATFGFNWKTTAMFSYNLPFVDETSNIPSALPLRTCF